MIKKIACSLLILLFVTIGLVHSKDFYVAKNGDDKNSGTETEPFATLTKARDAIRELKSIEGLPSEGITVWICGGVYQLDKTFELLKEDSGTKTSPIIYRSFNGEKVTISGGADIDASAFKPVTECCVLSRLPSNSKGKVLSADLKSLGITDYGQHKQFGHMLSVVEAPLELFFNNKAMPLARYPNEGGILIGKIIDKGSVPRLDDYSERGGIFEYTDDRHERWANVDDLWLQGTFCWGYADDKIKVEWIDKDKKQVKLTTPHMYGLETGKPFRKYVALNILEELDEPGEWYVDRKTGVLYFWPPADIKNSRISVSILEEPIIALEGASFITIRGLIIEIARGIGVYIEQGQDNTIAGCSVRNVGTSGIFMGQGSKQTFPHITHNKYEGVPISRHVGNLQAHIYTDPSWERKAGKNHKITGCDVYQTGCGGIYLSGGSKKKLIDGNCSVLNCKIYDYNRRNKFLWSAINVDNCGNIVAHNEVSNTDFQGIYVHGNEHLFEYNNIHHVAMDSDDTSPWYLGRDPSDRGNMIRYNFFHHIGRMDRMLMGVYFDDATCGVTVFGNVFYKLLTNHGVVYSNSGHDLLVKNNIFVDCGGAAVELGSYWYMVVDTQRIIDDLFSQYEKRLTKLIDIKSPPYSTRYPELTDWLDPIDESIIDSEEYTGKHPRYKGKVLVGMRARRNLMENNVIYKCPTKLKLNFSYAKFEERNNFETDEDPGFVDAANMNFQLKDNSIVYKKIPGFEKIPFEKIGLQEDEYRKDLAAHKN